MHAHIADAEASMENRQLGFTSRTSDSQPGPVLSKEDPGQCEGGETERERDELQRSDRERKESQS
jgi:hypothetical protein